MKREPPSKNQRRKGRPPLSDGARTIKTTVRFDETTVLRICGLVGRHGMADFVRRATEAQLAREEAEAEEEWERAQTALRRPSAGPTEDASSRGAATDRPSSSDTSRNGK